MHNQDGASLTTRTAEPAPRCPQCKAVRRDSSHQFCTQCGIALFQPCPHCAENLGTPSAPFTGCETCGHNFWSCRACGRLYHLDKTSCSNTYCPEKGHFWTTRFGSDQYHQTPSERHLPGVSCEDGSLRPAWVGGASAGADLRWPCLHSQGLILSVLDTGVVELWAERGAPVTAEHNEFGEKSVCLTRLDLGEPSPTPPFVWNQQFLIPGEHSLTALEFSSSPSFGHRRPLDGIGSPKHFAAIGTNLLIWGSEGVGSLSSEGDFELLDSDFKPHSNSIMVEGAENVLLVNPSSPPIAWLFLPTGEVRELDTSELSGSLEYGLYAGSHTLLGRNCLAYLENDAFRSVELPSLVVTDPIYDRIDDRLTLLLSDGSARTCSTRGEKFSFLCELGGTPTTSPLRLKNSLFYGIEGRYICRGGEAVRPRLPAAPMGALSYANGRLFGTTRDGTIFSFELTLDRQ